MIEVKNLTKRYGVNTALDNVSFTVDEGTIVGFLGPNGAGKSTTMNIITGYLSATSGSVTVQGKSTLENPNEVKKLIGYLPEMPPLYLDMTVKEYLNFMYELKGVKLDRQQHIGEICRLTKIDNVYNRLVGNLSKGYKQRVGIAQALLGSPKVIILDEPTVGLDPLQIIEIRDLIRQLGQAHTVILSSHILSEVQAICEKILIIAHGKLLAFGEPDQLERSLLSAGEIDFTTEADEQTVRSILSRVDDITDIALEQKQGGLLSARVHTDSRDIYAVSRALFFAFAARRQALLEMTLKKASLEDIFIELTESGDPAAQPQAAQAQEESEAKQA